MFDLKRAEAELTARLGGNATVINSISAVANWLSPLYAYQEQLMDAQDTALISINDVQGVRGWDKLESALFAGGHLTGIDN